MNISNFLANINAKEGIAKKNRVNTRILPPPGLMNNRTFIAGVNGDLESFCPMSALPGIYLENEQVRYAGIGKIEQRPIDVSFNAIQLEFFFDNKGEIISAFNEWMSYIVDFSSDRADMMLFSFPDDYVSTIEITPNQETGRAIKKYSLLRAYPVSIGDVITSWGENDSLLTVPVTFSYYTWKVE